jgi:tRNA threonylcarbamoyladenosine biosynthesis protein TsaE
MPAVHAVPSRVPLATHRAFLPDAAATERAGRALAPALAGGMLVTLSGPLGAGKTAFARGVLRGLGWTGAVKSPTYTLLEHYAFSSLYLYHFDFYRFADPEEWETAGVADAFTREAACLVEWPERVSAFLPPADLVVRIGWPADGDGRELDLEARTPDGERCLNAIAAALSPPPR